MKAVVKTKKGVGFIELLDIPKPEPGPNEVLVEVKAAGICGTDIHIYRDEFTYDPPVVLGHEFCGIIADVGKNVETWKPGDRVTSETAGKVCGQCSYCRTGRYNLCPERRGLGYHLNGAFAKYVVIPRPEILHRLPDNVDFVSGALCEPSAVATHGVIELTKISGGDFVAVLGEGPLGLLALQVAKSSGAGMVAVTGMIEARLEMAKTLGADLTINVEREDPVKIVMGLTEGYGANVVLECSGSPTAARQGLQMVRKGGSYTQLGLFGKPIEIDFDQIAYKELRVTGVFSQKWSAWETALKLISSGKLLTKPLVTHIFPIAEWQQGFDVMEKKIGIKVVLTPVD